MNTTHWGLQQGMLGARQETLKPTMASLGPNRYLTRDDFIKMIGIALVLHMVVLGVASLFRDAQVKDIPVRALTFKIGNADGAAPQAMMHITAPPPMITPVPKPISALPAAPVTPSIWQKNAPPPRIAPIAKIPAIAPITQPYERQHPADNPQPLTPLPNTQAAPVAQTPSPTVAPLAALPSPNLLAQPAVAPDPQRFVRENSVPQMAAGSPNGTVVDAAQTARARYEQEISGWIGRHTLYPAEAHGVEGRVVVRIRIDRGGNVRYYNIEESSNNPALDAAAVDMVRRANPMPAVPAEYPAGSLIEFLIPISFKAPR